MRSPPFRHAELDSVPRPTSYHLPTQPTPLLKKRSHVTLPNANNPAELRQAACTEPVERVLDHMYAQRIVHPMNNRDPRAQVIR